MAFLTALLGSIQSADWAVMHAIQHFCRCGVLDRVFPFITGLGNIGIVWILIALILMIRKKTRRYGILMLIALGIGAIVGQGIIKHLVQRPRPFILDSSVKLLISAPRDTSFPSGHSAAAATGAYMLCRMNKAAGIPAVILALLIAFSRMYLYVHFPSDVIAGLLLGVFTGWAVWKLGHRWAEAG